MDFGTKLNLLRKNRGLSQEELAQRINVTRQTISKWELGDTIPDMTKLIELSQLFEISIDELVGFEVANKKQHTKFHYEYKSKCTLWGIPLVHVNFGAGMYRAKGIIAIGNISTGIISLGILSLGILCFGPIGIGLLCLCSLGLGGIVLGGLVLGLLSIGGISIGIFSIGGVSIGIYAIGGIAIAKDIAYGGVAIGKIAIGNKCRGEWKYFIEDGVALFTKEELKNQIHLCYPNLWKVIINIFIGLV